MQRPEIVSLSDSIAEARDLLVKHGDRWTSSRLDDLERALDQGDMEAVQATVSEATGSMGSLNDRYLSVENGDEIQPDEMEAVNERLQALVREIEKRARVAAAALGIALVR